MEDLISVIVPIYNVAEYLEKCITSIICQTYKNIEIILVNDGSTDNSQNICDAFEAKDARVKVIHKTNGGITSSRKAGVQIAQGKYIGFVDGDDWIEENMYEELYMYMKRDGAQIVMSGMYRDNDTGTYAKWAAAQLAAGVYLKDDVENGICTRLFCDGQQMVSGSLNNKLFDAELLKTNLQKVDSRIHGFADDTVCIIPCLLEADKVTILDDAFYHGYDRHNSATHSRNENWFEQLNFVFFRLRDVFQNHPCHEILLQQLQAYIVNNIMAGVEHLFPSAKIQRFFWEEDVLCEKKRVVIYGAGKVGQSYFKQLNKSLGYDVVLWVDEKAEDYMKDGLNVCSVDQISLVEFDEIIIAVMDQTISEKITRNLVMNGISEEQIRWKKPIQFHTLLG